MSDLVYEELEVRVVDLQISIPIAECRRGATVLAAAVAQFGPQDPIRLLITPSDDTVPRGEHALELKALLAELESRLGSLPQIMLLPASSVDPATTIASVQATGDPAADAQAILVLASFGRRLGSTLRGNPMLANRPRGGFTLSRAETSAALWRRQLYRPKAAGDPVRIAVLLWTANFWPVVEGFVKAAQGRPDVEIDVVCPEFDVSKERRNPAAGEMRAFFAKYGITPRDEHWMRATLPALDIVATSDAYDKMRPPGLHARDLAEAGIRQVYLPYAQALSAEPQPLNSLFDLPLQNIAWRIYVASEGQRENFARYCQSGNEHVRFLGAMKNERLLTSVTGPSDARAIRQQLGTETVTLWNPHWSLHELSTFAWNLGPIMAYFATHPEKGLIARPHPKLLMELGERTYKAMHQVAAFRDMCDQLPNVYHDEDYDHVPAMLAADCMISDMSSVIPEYACLQRPIGYLRRGEPLLNADQAWLRSVVPISDEAELTAFLDRPTRPDGALTSRDDLGSADRIVAAMLSDYYAEVGLADDTLASVA